MVSVANIQFRSFGENEYFCGQVKTAQCPEDNSKVKEILSQDGSGQVLLIDGDGSFKVALLGDMIAKQAIENAGGKVLDLEKQNNKDKKDTPNYEDNE